MTVYNATYFEPPAPLALVTLKHYTGDATLPDVPMLLDTGADVTLIPQKEQSIMNLDTTLASQQENWPTPYQILETESGLQISESRVLLFDVMEAYDEGDSNYQICETFNLTPLQVKTAIAYIEKHRAALEPELAKAIQLRKEREVYHRRLAQERWAKAAPLPMTPLRAAVYALLEKNRIPTNAEMDADYPQRS